MIPGLTESFRLCQPSYLSNSVCKGGRRPTRLISPLCTLQSCGISSRDGDENPYFSKLFFATSLIYWLGFILKTHFPSTSQGKFEVSDLLSVADEKINLTEDIFASDKKRHTIIVQKMNLSLDRERSRLFIGEN